MPKLIERNEALIKMSLIVLGAVLLLSTIGHVYANQSNHHISDPRKALDAITLLNLPERVAKMEERQIRTEERVISTHEQQIENNNLLKGLLGSTLLLLVAKLLDWWKPKRPS
jgi:hypothetical protein